MNLYINTDEPVTKLLSFYEQRLNPKPVHEADIGLWGKEELDMGFYLFSCSSADINGLTTETGCIYIIDEESRRTVITELILAEGDYPQCARQKSDIPSLY